MLLKAELEFAERNRNLSLLYKKTIDALREYEEGLKPGVQAARGTNTAVLKIKARRLEVEIQMEQVKIKEAKDGK